MLGLTPPRDKTFPLTEVEICSNASLYHTPLTEFGGTTSDPAIHILEVLKIGAAKWSRRTVTVKKYIYLY